MAVALETVAELIKPLDGAIVRRYTAGSAITAGMPVAMASDGYVDPADGSDTTLSFALGMAIQSAAAAGDRIDVVVHGAMKVLTGATPGVLLFVSDTAGSIGTTAGTKSTVLGVCESATVLFVKPIWVTLT